MFYVRISIHICGCCDGPRCRLMTLQQTGSLNGHLGVARHLCEHGVDKEEEAQSGVTSVGIASAIIVEANMLCGFMCL